MDLLFSNDTRGAYPPSLYADQVGRAPARPALRGEVRADVAIVGAGYTGLSAALHLARAGRRVVVIEAHRAAFGASGRNGGQVGSGQRLEVDELERMAGSAAARRLWDMAEEAKALIPGAKEWRLLLQIGVDENAGFAGPGAYYVIIRDEDLAARRFERARVTYQCD